MADLSGHAVIFDMDGVLVDSGEAHFQAFQRMGEKLGAPFTRELLSRCFGMHNRQIIRLWIGEVSDAESVRIADEKEALYRELARGALREVPGARALAERVRAAGARLAVGSSGPRENVRLAVETLQADSLFETCVCGDDVRNAKPDPEVFLLAASRLGIPPSRCLVLEDALAGLRAAEAAGMRAVAITTSLPREVLAPAARIVDRWADLQVVDIARIFSEKAK